MLDLFARVEAHVPQARLARARWARLQEALQGSASKQQRRFHLRAYRRARVAALVVLLMRREARRPGRRLSAQPARRPWGIASSG